MKVLLWSGTPPCTAIRFYSNTGSPLTVSKPFWAGGVHRGTFYQSISSAVSCSWPCLTLLEPLCFSVHVLSLLPPLRSVLFGSLWCFLVLFGGLFRFRCVTIALAPPPSEFVLFGTFQCFLVLFRGFYWLGWTTKDHNALKSTTLRAF